LLRCENFARALAPVHGNLARVDSHRDPSALCPKWGFRVTSSLEELFGLAGQVAVVTGAGSGIGRAAAALLAQAGAHVAIVDRDQKSAEDAATEIDASAFALAADVADEAAVERLFSAVIAREQRIDILVNNAGIAIRRPTVELSLEDWNKVLAVNMTAVFLCSRIAARHMIASGKGGAIISTASIMGLSGGGLYPNISYQATKGAVVNMTRALAVEWAPHNIRVNAVAPTYVRTNLIKPILEQPDLVAKIEAMTPLKRLATPEEIAAAILFLASPAASMVTGHTLPVDGGFLAQ
jgi:2-deoxy-D-gluconate 3-dehydrogenase